MKQILFVLKEGQIAFWMYSRGSLAHRTLNGKPWNDYTPSYWNDWCAVNQPSELEDAIFLSDTPNGFGELPSWLKGGGEEPSAWSVDTLAELANDPDYEGKGVELHQGKAKYALLMGSTVDVYSLASSLNFVLPKEVPKSVEPELVKEEPKSGVLIAADCLFDDKSSKIAIGTSITATVKAYSKYRGCFLDTDAAGDQLRILPEECQKDSALSTLLQKIGSSIAAQVDSVQQHDGLIQLGLRIKV